MRERIRARQNHNLLAVRETSLHRRRHHHHHHRAYDAKAMRARTTRTEFNRPNKTTSQTSLYTLTKHMTAVVSFGATIRWGIMREVIPHASVSPKQRWNALRGAYLNIISTCGSQENICEYKFI